MKKLLHLLCLIISGIIVVSCYDDSALWDSVKDHESRISKLEAQCKELNTNITSLKTLVDAYLSADYITDVTPVMEGGEEVGYVITFAKNGKITIYHGEDGADGQNGQDGNAPKLGIKQDTDGSYYWTLNGEWLLDDNGAKIKAVGEDGADGANGADGADGTDGTDGITPTLKIEEEYWYISYDGGQTWTNLGKAVGEDGKDSMFSNVYEDNGYIIFTLVDGTSYRIPTEATAATANTLDIQFSVEQGTAIVPDLTTKIKYTITGAEGSTLVRTSSYGDDDVTFVKPIDDSTGFLYISMWSYFEGPDDPERDEPYYDNNEITKEEAYNSILSIIVIVTDSKGNQVMKALNFVEGFLSSVDDVYLTDPVAGSVEAKLKTNIANDSYEVIIPDKCKDWISYVPTKAELREETLTFSVTANEGDSFRSANISLINELGQTFETFTILQRSEIAGEAMTFADPRVEAICVARFDKNLDGVLTYEEAALVTDVEGLFENEKQIVSFDEFEHFSSVTTIPSGFFSACELLESVKLPESVMEIENYAFENCISLKSIVIPEGVTNSYNNSLADREDPGRYDSWFSGCSSLESITLPSTLKFLPYRGFNGCSSLKSITLPKGITKIPDNCFYGCSALSEIICESPITSVGGTAFAGCTSLKTFDLSSVESLGASAFRLSGLTSAIIPEAITSIPSELFRGCSDLETVIMHDNITSIGNNSFSTASYYDENDNRIEKACSSLKSLVLPAKLESIGYEAFYGSAIEGEPEDGTSAKLLNIPASVNTIGYEAFYNCPNISGVKMLGTVPPQIRSDVFDNGTPIYVQNNALQTYTNAYSDYSYPILPYDMMGLSLTLELELTGEGEYKNSNYDNYYRYGVVDFQVSAKVTGEESKLAQVTEYGYYITNYDDDGYNRGTTYFPLESLNVTQTDSLSVSREYFKVNAEAYVATANCQVGAYLRLTDDTIITYDKREMEFIYDRTPSVELIEAKQVETYRNGDYCYVTYEVLTRTSGAFWLNNAGFEADGVGDIDSYRYSYYDGDYKNTITWSYNVNEVPASMQIRFAYNASNGSSFTSNRITLTADISEASLLETIYNNIICIDSTIVCYAIFYRNVISVLIIV